MSKFGWSYPAGAENDPSAPYNQIDEGECQWCGLAINAGNNEEQCECEFCMVCQNHESECSCKAKEDHMEATKEMIEFIKEENKDA